MSAVNPPRSVASSDVEGAGEVKEANALTALLNEFNGNIDTSNLKAAAGIVAGQLADADKLGLTAGGTTRRGKAIIATEESRTNVAYGTMATPDQVTVVLPADGVILLLYQAMWKESVNGAARASIFVGSNQLRIADPGASAVPYAIDTVHGAGVADRYKPLANNSMGLVGAANPVVSTAYTGDVTTGQAIGAALFPAGPAPFGGGFCVIDADPGTYTVSIQFKASSGSVTVKNRRLRCFTMAP